MPASSRPSPRRLPAVPVGPRAPASFRPSASAVPATSATPSPSDAPRAIRPGPRATAFHATPPAPVPPAAACTVDSNPAGAGVRGPRPKPWQSSGATTPPAEASAASTVFCPAFTVSPASLAPPAVARALPPPPPPSGAEVTQTGVDDACVDDPPPPPYSAASIPVVDLPQPVYNRPSGAIATPSRSIGLEGLFERIDWIIEDMQPWFPGHAQRRELPASEWASPETLIRSDGVVLTVTKLLWSRSTGQVFSWLMQVVSATPAQAEVVRRYVTDLCEQHRHRYQVAAA